MTVLLTQPLRLVSMTTPSMFEGIPIAEYAFPGPLRDELIAAIKEGKKTTTSSLLQEYECLGEPLPVAGEREAVINSDGVVEVITRITAVAIVPLADITLEHALGEGEGFETVAQWRASHESFWGSQEFRDSLGAEEVVLDDTTAVVCQTFTVERLV